MGIDTKGVLLTDSKNVLLIGSLVEQTMENLVRKHMRAEFPGKPAFNEAARKRYSSPSLELRAAMGMMSVRFRCFGEDRDLKLFFTCDCDNTKLAPKSISLSLGCWGQSTYYVQTLLQALSLLGPVYFDANDCDDVDKAPLRFPQISLLQAVKLDYVRAHYFEDFVQAFISGDLKISRTFDEFVGLPQSKCTELLSLEHEARWDALKALADALPDVLAPQPEDLAEAAKG